jgi:hypothetical protein
MSVRASSIVWDHFPNQSQTQLLVLLALADRADDNGLCWPSIPTLAKKIRATDQCVQQNIRKLVDSNLLHKTESKGGRRSESGIGITNRYQINLEYLVSLPISGRTISVAKDVTDVRTVNNIDPSQTVNVETSNGQPTNANGQPTNVERSTPVDPIHQGYIRDTSRNHQSAKSAGTKKGKPKEPIRTESQSKNGTTDLSSRGLLTTLMSNLTPSIPRALPATTATATKPKGQSPEAIEFAQWFKTLLTDGIQVRQTDLTAWAKAYDEMVRLDKRNHHDIRAVCEWARNDRWYSPHFQSATRLRKRNSDGTMYFDIYFAKMKLEAGLKKPDGFAKRKSNADLAEEMKDDRRYFFYFEGERVFTKEFYREQKKLCPGIDFYKPDMDEAPDRISANGPVWDSGTPEKYREYVEKRGKTAKAA